MSDSQQNENVAMKTEVKGETLSSDNVKQEPVDSTTPTTDTSNTNSNTTTTTATTTTTTTTTTTELKKEPNEQTDESNGTTTTTSTIELRALARIDEDQYDVAAWRVLMNVATKRRPIADVRALFERCLKIFPTASIYWQQYAEYELKRKKYDAAQSIFERSLDACRHVGLWQTYMGFVETRSDVSSVESCREVVEQYERAVKHVGLDLDALPLWRAYITFVSKAAIGASAGEDDSRRMTTLRSLYQRAIATPLLGLEQLWKEYGEFEQRLNKTLARALVQEHGAKYMTARNAARQVSLAGRGAASLLELATPPRGQPADAARVRAWQARLDVERENPAHLDDDGCAARVAFTYEQALLVLRHYPHVWHDYAAHVARSRSPTAGTAILVRAIDALPTCPLLSFELSHQQEIMGNVAAAQKTLDTLLEKAPSPLAFIRAMELARRTQGLDAARRMFLKARRSSHGGWQVYVFAARLELQHAHNVDVARNLFEFGMKQYGSEPRFVAHYVQLLLDNGQPQNARALLERVLGTTRDTDAMLLWDLLVQLERAHGDIAALRAAEQRRATVYAALDPAALRVSLARYEALSLHAAAPVELLAASWAHPLPAPSLLAAAISTTAASANTDTADDAAAAAAARASAAAAAAVAALPSPDLSAMVAFDPLGTERLPASVARILQQLPPANQYNGPMINAEVIVRLLQLIRVPENIIADLEADNNNQNNGNDVNSRKRKAASSSSSTTSTSGTATTSTTTDIFRQRQAKKHQTQL